MTAAELLRVLRLRGVDLQVVDGRLRATAPAGSIDRDDQRLISERKAELIRLLASHGGAGNDDRDAEHVPLASAQAGVWMHQLLEPGSTLYNITIALKVTGPLDPDRLTAALRTVLTRHAPLRSVVTMAPSGGESVLADIPADLLPVTDLSSLPAVVQRARSAALGLELQRTPFDLTSEIPFRARLLRFSAESHDVIVAVHHVAFDGSSVVVFLRDLAAAYEGATPAPLRTSYGAYAAAQNAYWTPERKSQRAEFWRESLAGAPATHDVPTDRPRSPQTGHTGAMVRRSIDATTREALKALAATERATPFMVLHAALVAAVHRHSGQRDVVIGTPLHGRDEPEFSALVGMFVNQLPLRLALPTGASLRMLVREARRSLLGTLSAHELPFTEIVRALDVPRDTTRNPVFQIMLNVLPPVSGASGISAGELTFTLSSADDVTSTFDGQSKFDMTLYGFFDDATLELALVYNAELFDESRMQALLDDTETVLRDGVVRADEPVEALFAGAASEPAAADRMRRAGRTLGAASIPEQVLRVAADTPDAPAVIDGAALVHTYAGLALEAGRIARLIAGATADEPERAVGIVVPHDGSAVATLLGLLMSGRPYVPLDPKYPDSRLRFMVADAGLRVILASPALSGRAREMLTAEGRVVGLDETPSPHVALPPLPDPEAPAYLLYTSGSTGRPKAVVQSHVNLLAQATRYGEALALSSADRLAWLASISFDASLMDVFGGLVSGSAIAPIDARSIDLSQMPQLLATGRLTVLHVTPTVFRTIARSATQPKFPHVRAVVLGGEAVRPGEVEFFDGYFAPDAILFNLYGASEHSFSLGFEVDRHARSIEVPIGFPVGDTTVVLLNEQGQPDPVRGELVLCSPRNAVGYWQAPDLTARAFPPDDQFPSQRLYRSGDIVRRRPDGAYVFLHRADSQMKVRGHRIEGYDVERVILTHPAVSEVAVHAPLDETGEHALVACVAFRSDDVRPSVAELTTWCAEYLPTFMVPSRWATVERLPRTPSGKVDRRALPAIAASPAVAGIVVEPRDAEEAEVHQIWSEILGTSRFSVTDDFFVLGGNSLNATQVVSRLRELFDVELPLRHFFDHPTVADAARWIRDHRDTRAALPPLMVREKGIRTPLSFSQERMWFIQQLDPSASAYNMASAVVLHGGFDPARFARAVNTVARQQESLRTRILVEDGRPAQVIEPEPIHDFVVEDVSDLPDPDRLNIARARAESRMSAPYDLARDPLCRVLVVRLAPDRHVVAVGMHHVISDLWSMGVFGRLVQQAYERDGTLETGAPDGEVTYRDYTLWQREWLRGEALEQQVAYWRGQLHGLKAIDLPTDFPRPPFVTFDGDIVRMDLPTGFRERLRRFSAAHRATPFMSLLAAFNVLLAKYSGQHDIGVGVPIAGRRATATQDLIGTFVNTVIHRNDLAGDPPFSALLERVRATALMAFAHQDAPIELLVRELQVERDTSRQPLFQILFNVANASVANAFADGPQTTVLPLNRGVAQFDLTLNVGLNELQSDLQFIFNSRLFSRETVARFLADYVDILDRALTDPAVPLSALQQVSASDRALLLTAWNTPAMANAPAAPTTDMLTLIELSAVARADLRAVDSPSGAFTYAELMDHAHRVTGALQAMGVKRGDRVAIMMERSREMLGALLGILGAGAAYVPIDPVYPKARILYMLADAAATALVTHRGLQERFPTETPVLDLEHWTPPPPFPFVSRRATDPAYVIYTSGSTGNPKGVEIPHGAVANFLLSMRDRPGMGPDDALLAVTTISFDIAVLELYLPLVAGGRVVICSEDEVLDGHRLMERLDDSITIMQATPATWKLLIAAGWRGRTTLRILCGGEALSRTLAYELLTRAGQVWNMYGPTETTVWSTLDRVTAEDPILVGRPIANTSLYVLDDAQRLRPIGVPGELYIGGAGVAMGYVNRPDLTQDRFIDNPYREGERLYRTGDLVRYRPDGRVEHLGRLDNQVKVRGFRIELGEVESALRTHTAVRDAVVKAADDRLIAYVVLASGQRATNTDLRRHVSGMLPTHMVPAMYVMLDAIPLTPNGKVDRKALPEPGARNAPAEASTAANGREGPVTPSETIISAVWGQLLGSSSISRNDNFFEIGGHSLMAMEAVALIEQRAGRRLEPRSMFFKNLRELALALDAGSSN